MRKTLPVLAGLAAALFVSTTAEAVLTGIKSVVKSAPGARLFIVNLYVNFSAPGDHLIAVVGLPVADGPQLVYSTNSIPGFHQELVPLGLQDQPLNRILFGLAANYADDTYITIGLKHGYQGADTLQHVGALFLDLPPGATDWNAGGPLSTNVLAGGSYFVLPAAPQGVAVGGQVLIAQLVIDTNFGTTGGLPRIDIFIPQLAWADAGPDGIPGNVDDNTFSQGLGPPGANHIPGPGFGLTRIVPVPGTLALLGLAGLFGIRRRRR